MFAITTGISKEINPLGTCTHVAASLGLRAWCSNTVLLVLTVLFLW